MADTWNVVEKVLVFIILVLSIVSSVASWNYMNTVTSPFADGPLKGFDYAPRVMMGISSVLVFAASFLLPVSKDSKEKVGRICLFMAFSALVACTAILDPAVAIALGNSGTSSVVVKGVAIACMALSAVLFFFMPISSCRKDAAQK
ncbi:hypothetical protein LPJ58_004612 [Coemansia sp. RSA 1591]|nr:hypothetical protein LPJ58_004612 [Coemansia sp. RSA 1591]KAJ1757076.1 hypothetical protein LPJ69_004551 [Coemansia sp. RSA 1752]KAJ2143873.1 hypothetical protein J3F82_005188 [Coemansia sp. RSA 637]